MSDAKKKIETKGAGTASIASTHSAKRIVSYTQLDFSTDTEFIRLYITPISDTDTVTLEIYEWDGTDYNTDYENGRKLVPKITGELVLDKGELISILERTIEDIRDM